MTSGGRFILRVPQADRSAPRASATRRNVPIRSLPRRPGAAPSCFGRAIPKLTLMAHAVQP